MYFAFFIAQVHITFLHVCAFFWRIRYKITRSLRNLYNSYMFTHISIYFKLIIEAYANSIPLLKELSRQNWFKIQANFLFLLYYKYLNNALPLRSNYMITMITCLYDCKQSIAYIRSSLPFKDVRVIVVLYNGGAVGKICIIIEVCWLAGLTSVNIQHLYVKNKIFFSIEYVNFIIFSTFRSSHSKWYEYLLRWYI